jgi:hypothetical protein
MGTPWTALRRRRPRLALARGGVEGPRLQKRHVGIDLRLGRLRERERISAS